MTKFTSPFLYKLGLQLVRGVPVFGRIDYPAECIPTGAGGTGVFMVRKEVYK